MKQIHFERMDLPFTSVVVVCVSVVCVIACVVLRSVVKTVLIKTQETCKATL